MDRVSPTAVICLSPLLMHYVLFLTIRLTLVVAVLRLLEAHGVGVLDPTSDAVIIIITTFVLIFSLDFKALG